MLFGVHVPCPLQAWLCHVPVAVHVCICMPQLPQGTDFV